MDLKRYLDIDEEFVSTIDNKISSLNSELEELNNERIESEKNFEERLEAFKKQLEEEKEVKFNEFKEKENGINSEKNKIIDIKTTEETNRVEFEKILESTSVECDSKIASVKEAIKACGENEALERALEEEESKKEQKLNSIYEERKQAINDILVSVNLKEPKKTQEVKIEETPTFEEVNVDKGFNEEVNDNEIVSHEAREDVVKDVLGSEEIMEGHVFPFLREN